jgi:SAM-dependent methyltransferase
MATLVEVEAYFSNVANSYQAASGRALWRKVREREAKAVVQTIGDIAGRDALELGCGAGYYTRLLIERGARHVCAVDLSSQMLDQLPAGPVTALQGDASTIDPGRRFSVLLSAGMLEFVPDPLAVLRHAGTLACPDGAFTILYPTDTVMGRIYRRFHRRNGLSIALFDHLSMERLATEAGWRLVSTIPAGPYSACSRLVRRAGV